MTTTDTEATRLSEGDKVWFSDQRQGFTVQAVSEDGRYAVCTKPFNAQHTVIYTVIDFVDRVRGVDNTVGNNYGYETKPQCEEACSLFVSGRLEFSHRNRPIPLDITKVKRAAAPQ